MKGRDSISVRNNNYFLSVPCPWAKEPITVADLGAHPASLHGPKCAQISRSFSVNLANWYVGWPPGWLALPSPGNPVSAFA